MKLRFLLCGLGGGTALCLAGILGLIHVREAGEHTTFHPDHEINTPCFFILLGVVVIAVSLIAAIVGALRKRGATKTA